MEIYTKDSLDISALEIIDEGIEENDDDDDSIVDAEVDLLFSNWDELDQKPRTKSNEMIVISDDEHDIDDNAVQSNKAKELNARLLASIKKFNDEYKNTDDERNTDESIKIATLRDALINEYNLNKDIMNKLFPSKRKNIDTKEDGVKEELHVKSYANKNKFNKEDEKSMKTYTNKNKNSPKRNKGSTLKQSVIEEIKKLKEELITDELIDDSIMTTDTFLTNDATYKYTEVTVKHVFRQNNPLPTKRETNYIVDSLKVDTKLLHLAIVPVEDCSNQLNDSGRYCFDCQRLFPNVESFRNHVETHSSTDTDDKMMNGPSTSVIDNMIIDLSTNTEDLNDSIPQTRNYCFLCQRYYVKAMFTEHIADKHMQNLNCYCGKEFPLKELLLDHQKLIHGAKDIHATKKKHATKDIKR